ncbi:Spermidine hydroxycinnamoyl transferase [Glycine max]|nr:Spermidine hydroxycinnamoyl transferase [Glycine max]
MATIKASHTVVPNQPTPKGRLWLSNSDQTARPAHTPNLYIYKAKHNIIEYDIEKMIDSLSIILVYYYPVAGRLSVTESGRMEVDCNAKGVTLIEAETVKTIDDFGDFTPSESVKEELVPVIDYHSQPIEEIPLVFVQVTRFKGDKEQQQGLAIAVAVSHPVADGSAWIHFINTWAKVNRGDMLGLNDMPFIDRTILKSSSSLSSLSPPPSPRFDHPELQPLPFILGRSDSTEEQKKKTTAAMLKLTSEQVEMLRKKVNENENLSTKQGSRSRSRSRPCSRFEAVAAHIWRCACKARKLDRNQPTLVRFNADFRSRLTRPLPRNYFGNALAATVTPESYAGEITSRPLSYAARKLREAVEMLKEEYITSQLEVVLGEEQLESIKALFSRQGERRNSPFAGNPNLQITSWISIPLYEADFGWGKPEHFVLGYVCPFDRGIIIRGPENDGSVIVIMYFQIAHMQLFKKFFYEDVFTSRL